MQRISRVTHVYYENLHCRLSLKIGVGVGRIRKIHDDTDDGISLADRCTAFLRSKRRVQLYPALRQFTIASPFLGMCRATGQKFTTAENLNRMLPEIPSHIVASGIPPRSIQQRLMKE
jgi:hypothetical protein